jgi:hypothetical protein
MARILISDPDDSTLRSIEGMLTRLGHAAAAVSAPVPGWIVDADLFVVDPTGPLGGVLAKAAHISDPTLPIVCASAGPPPHIDVPFTAWLAKPFTAEGLGAAIELGLAQGARRANRDTRRHAA